MNNLIQALREANPCNAQGNDAEHWSYLGWNAACDKLSELLKQQPAEWKEAFAADFRAEFKGKWINEKGVLAFAENWIEQNLFPPSTNNEESLLRERMEAAEKVILAAHPFAEESDPELHRIEFLAADGHAWLDKCYL